MCGRFNRTGISCGKCKPGLSPLILSYNLSCVECTNTGGSLLYLDMPLSPCYTLSSYSSMSMLPRQDCMVMFYSIKCCLHQYILVIMLIAIKDIPWLLNGAKALETFWNLEPFRSILPDTCLNVDTLTIFALEACIALYPLVLMIVSYCLIELYGRNVSCIVVIWKPFHSVFFTYFVKIETFELL